MGIKQLYKWIKYSNREYSSEEIECRIGNMTPREFEIFCGNLFRELGYKCKVTSESIDGGKDVILEDEYGEIIYVECKHYKKENLVNREVLQKLVGASVGDGINKAIIITTSDYTARAYEYALNVKWLELWTMKDLIKAMGKIKKQGFVLYKLEG
ncbi:MAG: restriction endonuclease [Clostridium sp.]|uniref:restriction endonuclease n=1 Tax=Clostridium sp. TaxID=1506 RepID=UPI002A8A6214|nr:restriction endonuclease [Clostridium sp.]MDY5096845.1 restriction endonuclease [Clostridium sp.]